MSRRVALFVGLFVGAAVVASLLPLPPRPTAAADVALPGCTSKCGNMSIPHPFGVEPGCYLPGLNITCRNDSSVGHHHGSPKLFIGDGTVEVLEISVANATVRINSTFDYIPSSGKDDDNLLGPNPITNSTWSGALGKGSGVYTLGGQGRKRMFAVGCNIQVLLLEDEDDGHGEDPNTTALLSTCSTLCDWDEHGQRWSVPGITDECSGIACCQATVMKERSSYGFKVLSTNAVAGHNSSGGAMVGIVDSKLSFYDTVVASSWGGIPTVMDWWIVNHTTCHSNGSSAACRSSHSFCKNDTDDGTRQALSERRFLRPDGGRHPPNTKEFRV